MNTRLSVLTYLLRRNWEKTRYMQVIRYSRIEASIKNICCLVAVMALCSVAYAGRKFIGERNCISVFGNLLQMLRFAFFSLMRLTNDYSHRDRLFASQVDYIKYMHDLSFDITLF